jgi:hypothetical protein
MLEESESEIVLRHEDVDRRNQEIPALGRIRMMELVAVASAGSAWAPVQNGETTCRRIV